MRHHVEPPPALISSIPRFHRHIRCISLNSSSSAHFDSLCLSDSVFVRIHPCSSRQGSLNDRSDSLRGIRHYVALSLFHAVPALHILGSLQCVRERPQTSRRILWVQPLALFQPQSLAMVVPFLSLSAVDFLAVNFSSGATICQRILHKPSQFVDSHASLSVCLVQLFASHNSHSW